jgi:DNA-directed RNA polymerase subunit M/transcription elongation factor TFIIS
VLLQPPPPPLHENPQRASLLAFLAERSRMTPEQARDAEIGVFNWTLARADERRIARNWRNPRFRSLYDSKARSVAANFDPASYVSNDRLIARIEEGEFMPHAVASMPPENIFPERWRDVVEMKVRRDEYISNAKPTAMTDQFKCGRCKKRECSYMELQTRSCDEPATLFIQCLSCGHRWRMG